MKSRKLVPLALAVLLIPPAVLADGTVVRLTDTAQIERGGKTMPAAEGSALRSGDILLTSEVGKAQVRFADDSVFAIPRNSAFKVEQFDRSQRGASGGTAIFALLRGGFRTITGLIGTAKNDKYEVRTGVATIGVRGTGYATVTCANQCPKKFPKGNYTKAERGIVIVANAHGKLELRAGQAAYVESELKAPVRVRVTPFDDPAFAADFAFDAEFEFEIDPDRVEPPPSVSPS